MKKLYLILILAVLAFFVNDASAQKTEVTFYTTKGNFKVLLTDSLTPVTVDSFLARVGRKFYDGLIFHRVIANFMIQGGDPSGTGSGGTGTKIPDEFHSSLKNIAGALSMANTGTPNTGDCQFFINVKTNSHLDNKHTVFGTVTQNYNVVDTISKVATSGPPTDKPITDVKMDSIRVTKWPVSVTHTIGTMLGVNIHPNPNNGVFSISLPAEQLVQVIITDISGRMIHKAETEQVDVLKVDMSHQPKGIYLVRMTTGQTTAYGKIIVQ